MNLEETKGLK